MNIISNNNSDMLSSWLSDAISKATNNYTKPELQPSQEEITSIITWAENTNPDLSKYSSIESALKQASKWNKTSNKKTSIHRLAKSEPISAELIATYIESLKMFEKDNPKLKEKFSDLIDKLPSPEKVMKDMSHEEIKVLFETVGYLWSKITGKDILEESHITYAPESLSGSYWMVNNGILLHGLNHYSIIKTNSQLLQTLLNLNGFALQQYLASPPNKLMLYIIKNGGMRMHADKTRSKIYFQLSEETYAKWGRRKIKKYDFKEKIVKIIDPKSEYNGWDSGVTIYLT